MTRGCGLGFEIFEAAEGSKMIQGDFKLDTCRIFGLRVFVDPTTTIVVGFGATAISSRPSKSPRNSPGDSQALSFNALGFLSWIDHGCFDRVQDSWRIIPKWLDPDVWVHLWYNWGIKLVLFSRLTTHAHGWQIS